MSTPIKMILSTTFFCGMQVCVKLLQNIPIFQIIFFRSFVIIAICLFLAKKNNIYIWGKQKKILFLRGVFGAIALGLFFYTLHRIPLASAITIQYLSPIFTVILASFFLKEAASATQWMFLLMAFAGIFCIQGFDGRVYLSDAIFGILSAFMAASAYNVIRVLKQEEPLVVVFYFPLVCMILFTPHTFLYWKTPSLIELAYLVLAGLFTYYAQLLMTQVYQKEKASDVVHYKYLGAIFSLLIGYYVFNEHLVLMAFIGMSLVIFAAICSTIYASRRKKCANA